MSISCQRSPAISPEPLERAARAGVVLAIGEDAAEDRPLAAARAAELQRPAQQDGERRPHRVRDYCATSWPTATVAEATSPDALRSSRRKALPGASDPSRTGPAPPAGRRSSENRATSAPADSAISAVRSADPSSTTKTFVRGSPLTRAPWADRHTTRGGTRRSLRAAYAGRSRTGRG